MTNKEKYSKIFEESFSIGADQLSGLTYDSIPEWDSIGHMSMISELEDAFDIELDTDDITDLSSFEKGMEILAKYDIQF